LKIFLLAILLLLSSRLFSQSLQDSQPNLTKTKTEFIKPFIAPVLLTAGGLLTLRECGFMNKFDLQKSIHYELGSLHTQADDYLQFVPLAATYMLMFSGVQGNNDLINTSLMVMKAEALSMALVYGLKYSTAMMRPDSSNRLSFPSGHTAFAFTAATILHREYGERSIWYSIGGYTTATAVALMRVWQDRHWVPDVLVSSAIGIASANLICLTHHNRQFGKQKNKQAQLLISPSSFLLTVSF
jgi:membrane-associated phospholipid phosphatase